MIFFYCFRYDFSVALMSALALLKYANLRLTVSGLKIDWGSPQEWSKNRLGISPGGASIYGMRITSLPFVLHNVLV